MFICIDGKSFSSGLSSFSGSANCQFFVDYRPMNIHNYNNTFSYGANDYSLTNGLYPTNQSLINELNATINGYFPDDQFTIEDFKITLTASSGRDIIFNEYLATILGCDTDYVGVTELVGDRIMNIYDSVYPLFCRCDVLEDEIQTPFGKYGMFIGGSDIEFGAIQMIDLHKRTLRRPGGTLFEIEYKNKYNQTVDMISDNYLFVDTINKW